MLGQPLFRLLEITPRRQKEEQRVAWWLWVLDADKSCCVFIFLGKSVCLMEGFEFASLSENKLCVRQIAPGARLSHQVCLSHEEDAGMEIPVSPRFPFWIPPCLLRLPQVVPLPTSACLSHSSGFPHSSAPTLPATHISRPCPCSTASHFQTSGQNPSP